VKIYSYASHLLQVVQHFSVPLVLQKIFDWYLDHIYALLDLLQDVVFSAWHFLNNLVEVFDLRS
jgi:hypothetical protein